jgi:transcription-repair coupling factor (superfamily II helicase)
MEKRGWNSLPARLAERSGAIDIVGVSGAATACAVAEIQRRCRLPMVVVTDSVKGAETFFEQLCFFCGDTATGPRLFPAYNISPYKLIAYHNETAARRIQTLYHMVEGPEPSIYVTPVDAILQRLMPKPTFIDFSELVMAGEELDRDRVIDRLAASGYSRVVIVEEPGDFSVRGGILDVFTPLYADPLRIEFFGNQVESIRFFSADTQRTLKEAGEVILLPAREAVLRPSRLNHILGRIRKRATEQGLPVTKIREIVQRIKNEGVIQGVEGLLPMVYASLDTLFDYLPAETLFVLVEPSALWSASDTFLSNALESYGKALERQQLCLEPEALYLRSDDLKTRLAATRPLMFNSLPVYHPAAEPGTGAVYETRIEDTGDIRHALQAARSSETPFLPLVEWFNDQKAANRTTLVACRRLSQIDRLTQILAPHDVSLRPIDAIDRMVPDHGLIYVTGGPLKTGFVWPEAGLACITDEDIFGTSYRPRRSTPATKVSDLLNYEDLKQGDLVVHIQHGIGRYEGLVKLRVDGSVNDFLLIFYKDDDKLYLPVERMTQLQKYMGVDDIAASLDKMGGKTWERIKAKVKRSTEKIAGELLKLYAARKVQKGHSFGAVDTYFRDFEDGFPYEETVDQHKAIDDVLADMRRQVPMDRLICGDVGYGKTEVALRAAFLAVGEAKQVAVLVPTTVLAEQHFATFQERFKRYPVTVAALNRFRPAAEQRKIAAGLKEGTIDIVIGTHRMLSKDIEFKELGLLILDEEQRFGVRHKERIKRMRANVDVLTLTATPIPRTLHLSLLGIRDISIISTPPEQRRSIVTFISEFDDSVVADAIAKELARGGQIFFVHNHVQSIQRMADHLTKLVPRVRLAVAHGRMPEEELEKVMLDFMQHRLDMLVCTTIIESGLDVATANTILINRADKFGLSQIYQLRGRVGRSDEQAYAFLFIPNETILTKDAQKRLKVLMEHSDLGSGFQIAMSDLKIRGGGTILGASQSGHIAAVGYDMFLKLMESSIAELKGDPIQEPLEPEINLPISAYLPETYIPDIDQRLSLYRRLARMDALKSISALKAEMEDRFGKLPEEAGNLLLKIMLKVVAVGAGCKRVDLAENQLSLQFSRIHQKRPLAVVDMVSLAPDRYRLTKDNLFTAVLTPGRPNALLSQAKNILIEIARHVNQ